jgi:ADP-ribose pyrophosphatase YjhB (NUDIX family)
VDERRFARLRRATDPAPDAVDVPDDGMCLSAFLLVRPEGRDGEVLLGRLAPAADWARIGGLDAARVARVGDRWMLPSSQLLLGEPPTEAAARIAREQLGVTVPTLVGPSVYSEAYRRSPGPRDAHWDLHFVFHGRWPTASFPPSPAFRELAFIDVARLPRAQIARSQGDVLELAGLVPAP